MNERKFLSLIRQYDALERKLRRDYSAQVAAVVQLHVGEQLNVTQEDAEAKIAYVRGILSREYVGKKPSLSVTPENGILVSVPDAASERPTRL